MLSYVNSSYFSAMEFDGEMILVCRVVRSFGINLKMIILLQKRWKNENTKDKIKV